MKLDKYSLMQAAGLEPKIEDLNESMLNEDAQWPVGHFVVQNTFEITPGGGWSVRFSKGEILRVTNAGRPGDGEQKIESWNALKSDWTVKRPPISGMETFPIDNFSGSGGWVAKFVQNTKMIGQAQATSMANSMAKETVLSARDAIKMLGGLSPNTQVKITLI